MLGVAWIIVPLILIAECFSWYAVLTTNFLYNAIENSLWAVAFFLVGLGLCRLLPEFQGPARIALILSIVGIVAYLASKNGRTPGAAPLPTDTAALAKMGFTSRR